MPFFEVVLGMTASLLAAAGGQLLQTLLKSYFPQFAKKPTIRHDIDSKLAKAHIAMREASEYMTGLQHGLERQQADLKLAEAEYQKFRAPAEAENTKADAFLSALQQTINSGNKRERVWNFGIGLLANLVVFFLGVIASDTVKAGWAAFIK